MSYTLKGHIDEWAYLGRDLLSLMALQATLKQQAANDNHELIDLIESLKRRLLEKGARTLKETSMLGVTELYLSEEALDFVKLTYPVTPEQVEFAFRTKPGA